MDKDPFRYFRVESKELLDGLSQGVLELEARTRNPSTESSDPSKIKALISQLLRHAHTMKGAARVVKELEISESAHAIEESLAPFREGNLLPPQETIEHLLASLDRIGTAIRGLSVAELKPDRKATQHVSVDDAFDTVRVGIDDLDQLIEKISDTMVGARSFRGQLDELESASRETGRCVRSLALASELLSDSGKIRLRELEESVQKIDRTYQSLPGLMDRIESELLRVRERANELRLLPVSTLFPSLRRSLRDAAEVLNKRVDLETTGDNTRLEANVLSVVKDALLHIVRNSVAHGIESAPERLAAGKPEVGRVRVSVKRDGNQVVFTCEDDGRGIDLESIRKAALRTGALDASEAAALTMDHAVELLLQGGISTTVDANQVSGRGVGLDVARNCVAELQGSIHLNSESQRGTKVILKMRVSIESLSTIELSVNDTIISIPSRAIRGTVKVSSTDVIHAGDGDCLLYEGASIPYIALSSVLFPRAPVKRRQSSVPVLIVQSGDSSIAVEVDRIRNLETVTVRSLPSALESTPLMSGVFLNMDGDPQLVLDPDGLLKAKAVGKIVNFEKEKEHTILVIDDSLTTRMLEQSILESAGFKVSLAVSAEEGLEFAKKSQFDLFVVDVEMPGMNGFEFIECVQREARLRDIPAILVTSRASPEDRKRGREVGARGHIMKSEFEQGRFLQTVRELVGSHRI